MLKNKGIAFLLAVLGASPLAALAQSVREDRFDRTTAGPTYRGQLSDQDGYRKLSVSLTALKLQPGLDEAMADQDSPYQEAYQHIKAACQLFAQYEELRHSNGLSSENSKQLSARIKEEGKQGRDALFQASARQQAPVRSRDPYRPMGYVTPVVPGAGSLPNRTPFQRGIGTNVFDRGSEQPPSGRSYVDRFDRTPEEGSPYGGPNGDEFGTAPPGSLPTQAAPAADVMRDAIAGDLSKGSPSLDTLRKLGQNLQYVGVCSHYFELAMSFLHKADREFRTHASLQEGLTREKGYIRPSARGNDDWSRAVRQGDAKVLTSRQQESDRWQKEAQDSISKARFYLTKAMGCVGTGLPAGVSVRPYPPQVAPVQNPTSGIDEVKPKQTNQAELEAARLLAELKKRGDDERRCPLKPLATTSFTPGFAPPAAEIINPDNHSRFFRQYPGLSLNQDMFDIVHAISPKVLTAFPELFSTDEILYDIRNLRGVCRKDCPTTKYDLDSVWSGYIAANIGKPITRDEVITFARRSVDGNFGNCFYPIRNDELNPLPVCYYRRAVMKEISQHIADAQALRGKPKILHYLKDSEIANRNRTAALRSFRNKPIAQDRSWDEYPFASTLEGGLNASVRAVPRSEQAEQAKVMRSFYAANKMTAGDPFKVEVVP